MPTLNLTKNGGTITVSVSSTPTANTTTYNSLPSYVTREGNVLTLPENTGYNRTFSMEVTATTNPDAAYAGTASSSSAWTVSQTGDLGPEPQYTWTVTNNSSTYKLYLGTITGPPTTQGFEIEPGETKYFNDTMPFTITSIAGSVSPSKTSGQIIVTNSTGGSIVLTYNSAGSAWVGTGSLTVNSSANAVTIAVI